MQMYRTMQSRTPALVISAIIVSFSRSIVSLIRGAAATVSPSGALSSS